MDWFALNVKVRHERRAADGLNGKAHEVFLPYYRTVRRWSDRMKQVEEPLFPGYLFARIDINNRLPVLTTPNVLGIVNCAGTPVPVEPQIINDLKQVVGAHAACEPWDYMNIGQTVRIISGSLTGVEGILVQTRSSSKLVLSVDLLHRSVAIEISRELVEPVERSHILPMFEGLSAAKRTRDAL